LSLLKVRKPSQTALLVEGGDMTKTVFGENLQGRVLSFGLVCRITAGHESACIAYPHNLRINVGFVDGHVATQKCPFLGSHLDIASAVRIGLIPDELAGKVAVIGNASLAGAAELLLDRGKLKDTALIASRARHVPLGGNPWFNEAYMEEMLFPEE